MAVPVKSASVAPRELEFLDLDDDALIMIIDKLDHKSKLQMMSSCKRIEGLIGQTHQFYKNFKICYNQKDSQKMEDARYLTKIKRRFQIVEISGGSLYFASSKLLSPSVLEFLKKHGADILKVKFQILTFHKKDFLESLKALSNVKEFEIMEIQFTETDPDESLMDVELKHLTKIEISGKTNLRFCARVRSIVAEDFENQVHMVSRILGC
jgi:hypothetical protein